jgi:hypothetical protein
MNSPNAGLAARTGNTVRRAHRQRLTGVEEVIAELIEHEIQDVFGISADGLDDAEWIAIERLALVQMAKSRLRANGKASTAMKDAVQLAVKFYGLNHPKWLEQCLDAAEEYQ